MVKKMQLFQMCDEPHTMDMLDEETEMKQVLKRESLLHSSRKFVLSGAEKSEILSSEVFSRGSVICAGVFRHKTRRLRNKNWPNMFFGIWLGYDLPCFPFFSDTSFKVHVARPPQM